VSDTEGAIAADQVQRVAGAVALERLARAVELPTVGLDDEPLLAEEEVDLLAFGRR